MLSGKYEYGDRCFNNDNKKFDPIGVLLDILTKRTVNPRFRWGNSELSHEVKAIYIQHELGKDFKYAGAYTDAGDVLLHVLNMEDDFFDSIMHSDSYQKASELIQSKYIE